MEFKKVHLAFLILGFLFGFAGLILAILCAAGVFSKDSEYVAPHVHLNYEQRLETHTHPDYQQAHKTFVWTTLRSANVDHNVYDDWNTLYADLTSEGTTTILCEGDQANPLIIPDGTFDVSHVTFKGTFRADATWLRHHVFIETSTASVFTGVAIAFEHIHLTFKNQGAPFMTLDKVLTHTLSFKDCFLYKFVPATVCIDVTGTGLTIMHTDNTEVTSSSGPIFQVNTGYTLYVQCFGDCKFENVFGGTNGNVVLHRYGGVLECDPTAQSGTVVVSVNSVPQYKNHVTTVNYSEGPGVLVTTEGILDRIAAHVGPIPIPIP